LNYINYRNLINYELYKIIEKYSQLFKSIKIIK